MNLNDRIHGFRVKELRPLPEVSATLVRMEFEKNGADLVWLDREDDNKTFAIGFKTIPRDDTGVFHILEHSVLCGSDRYPVREPFVELIKSSLQTFLNAFTFPDKTVYPVCSRNNQDFLNLMDVYLDAVFHPLSLRDPHAFRQEGWHWELDTPADELRVNGVVYNEMKGAYASPDSVLEAEMFRLLCPDNCYRFSSGGMPEHIRELTYEEYLAGHARYYHPSNSYIFLDGSVDMEQVLAKLESVLTSYDRIVPDTEIPMQGMLTVHEGTAAYEIAPEEVEADRVILALGWLGYDYADAFRAAAQSVLEEVLCGSNEAPLCREILEQGLAEDVCFATQSGLQQNLPILEIRNTRLERREEIFRLLHDRLEQLARDGLDREELHAAINHLEFTTRERDYGTMPKGLMFGLNMLESWLYGGDPAQNLCFEETFSALRRAADEDGFRQLIRELYLDNPNRVSLTLLPDPNLGDKRRTEETRRCAAAKAVMTGADLQHVMEQFRTLRLRQETPDSPEQLATIPMLSISDISPMVTPTFCTVHTVDSTTVLHHAVETDGITYFDLYFNCGDIPLEQLPQVSFITALLGDIATEHYTPNQLRSQISANLGNFEAGISVFPVPGRRDVCRCLLRVGVSLLNPRKAEAVRLTEEILNHTSFRDTGFIRNILRQEKQDVQDAVSMRGSSFAVRSAQAENSAKGAALEMTSGLSYLRFLQQAEKKFDTQGTALCEALQSLCKKLFTLPRVTMTLTGQWDGDFVASMLKILLDDGTCPAPLASYPLQEKKRRGVTIPADIGFAGRGFYAGDTGGWNGAAFVAAQYLTYDYLWNNVRVKGGAYGTGMRVTTDGEMNLNSYRDPNPSRTLQTFRGMGDALRTLSESGESLDRYIISTVADLDPLMSPRIKGLSWTSAWFSGRTDEARQLLRSEILATDAAALQQVSRSIDDACEKSGVCVVGGSHVLAACGDALEEIESL